MWMNRSEGDFSSISLWPEEDYGLKCLILECQSSIQFDGEWVWENWVRLIEVEDHRVYIPHRLSLHLTVTYYSKTFLDIWQSFWSSIYGGWKSKHQNEKTLEIGLVNQTEDLTNAWSNQLRLSRPKISTPVFKKHNHQSTKIRNTPPPSPSQSPQTLDSIHPHQPHHVFHFSFFTSRLSSTSLPSFKSRKDFWLSTSQVF